MGEWESQFFIRLIASSPHHPIAIWVLALILAYAWWLPAVYHHGRYLIPVIPILVLYGLEGGRLLLARLSFRVLPGIAGAAVFVVLAFSWLRGAQVYTQNVAYVNDHHVALARWLAANTSETGLVATHDIGAVGYLAGRRLVDIAGLATPELQASTRDVRRVKQVLSERMVEHVAILPDWYPPLTDSLIADPAYTVVAPPGAGGFLVLERLR